MAAFLGLDPEASAGTADALASQVRAVAVIVSEVDATSALALTQVFRVEPGETGMSPYSRSLLTSAKAFLRTAQANADGLIERLRGEIQAQANASGNAGYFDSAGGWVPEAITAEAFRGLDVDEVAAMWARLGDPLHPLEATPAQLALLERHPELFGNLDGIPFTHRNIANNITLDDFEAAIAVIDAESRRLIDAGDFDGYFEFLSANGHDAGTVFAARESIAGIRTSLVASASATSQLVTLVVGPPVLAGVSIGNLDTATQVTINVPGMGTTVAGSMEEWTRASDNLYREQGKQNELYRPEESLAVVSWIGYDTPRQATQGYVDVLSSERAVGGGDSLASLLEGITAARGWAPGENLSVVAHSYGTTTAAFAVAQTPVENLTLLASAGLDSSVSTVGDLMVDADRVWASEAEGDWVADLGRGNYIVQEFGGRVQWSGAWFHDHPVNPTEELFGGQVFSSEDSVVNGVSLEGSDWHSVAPQVSADVTGESTDQYGYLDSGTTPLRNTALTSIGLGDYVVSSR